MRRGPWSNFEIGGGGGTRHFFLLNLYISKNIGGSCAPPPPGSAVPVGKLREHSGSQLMHWSSSAQVASSHFQEGGIKIHFA